MKTLYKPFMYLAGLGLVLSVVVHVLSLVGLSSLFGKWSWGLHIGIFIVWVPTIFAGNKLVKDFRQKDFWKAALRACPKWMKHMTYFFFGYAILSFILFFTSDSGSRGTTPADLFLGFSGHWMMFYCVAMAILYSDIHVEAYDDARRCPNGHIVSPVTNFCGQCGAEVVERQK